MNKLVMIALAVLLAGCATPDPKFQTGPDAEKTFDGLVRIDGGRFRDSWADPDIDFSQYNKFMTGNAVFEFRAVKKNDSASMLARSSQTEFYIDDAAREKLIQVVTEVFDKELAKSERFTRTDKPGPDTMIIVGALHDIVSRVPPDTVGRSEIFLSSVGEATLILEGRDSLTGETIFRAVDRRRAETPGEVRMSNSVTNMSEVRRMAQSWAVRLREGLDSIHD